MVGIHAEMLSFSKECQENVHYLYRASYVNPLHHMCEKWGSESNGTRVW